MGGEKEEMMWSVTTHEHRDRSTDWYWTLAVLALGGAGVSIFIGNVLLAVIIVLGAGSIGFLAARGPREHVIKIDDRGLLIDGTRYPFSSIHSFWIEHDTDHPRLFVTMRGLLMSHLSLMLDSAEQGERLREYLKRRTQEEEQGPHIGEHLAELLGL